MKNSNESNLECSPFAVKGEILYRGFIKNKTLILHLIYLYGAVVIIFRTMHHFVTDLANSDALSRSVAKF